MTIQWEEQAVEDLLIETEGKTAADVAREVLARIGWVRTAAEPA